MSITIIEKNNPERWVVARNITYPGAASFKCFGNIGPVNETEFSVVQSIVKTYMTEDELETEINRIAGDSNYYKDAVETDNPVFIGESEKYTSNLE
tara:strand:- start:346 stop:633 length:288 start_codon:yes stop_codon:yes gene_type:complete